MYAQTEQSNISTGPALKYYRRYLQFMSMYYTHRAENRKNEYEEENGKKRRNCGVRLKISMKLTRNDDKD